MSSRRSSSKPDDESIPYRKPRADVFTMLLIIALLAILFGIAMLWGHMKTEFDWKMKGGPNPTLAPPRAAGTMDGMS